MGPREMPLWCPLPCCLQGLRPLPKPVDTSARALSWDIPWLLPVQCSQSLPLLPATSHNPSPTGPQLQAAPAPLPQARAPSQPALLSPLFFRFLQAMAAAVALVLALLVLQHGLKLDDHTDVATSQRMQQREEYLRQEMTRLLQEIESRPAWEDIFSSVWQRCPPWTPVGVLVLLAEVWWCCRKVKLVSESCSGEDCSSSKEEDEDKEEEEDRSGARSVARPRAVSTPSPRQGLPDTCQVLKELVGELLEVCQVLCRSTFMPEMQPAVGLGSAYETWSIGENSIAYSLLVLLWPPPGHSFSLELDTAGQLPATPSRIRVEQQCLCSREQLLGDALCFLHHPEDELRRDQSSVLPRTLCTLSCLDMEKVTCWAQGPVRSAWLLLPQSCHCQLTVLPPSSQSCRFQLTSTSKWNITVEMMFGAHQGSSDT
ncbi:inositol 1,4,5-trisphosphate receptor-interacting protein-like 1 [Tyto alba]|uniref:inositol 1,4,5-trisphosphate receptor-interacting protein-like 1 n=1 Tax=Tyto alba TaxID=56313 RepID=UPI001C66C1E4|nr:inositol 1,4,5-trisphosphate receptor-interacting protein-like 1 [Tyto alba]